MDHSVRSPCIANCKLDDEEVCQGCFRTLDEIINWSTSSNIQKQAVIDRVTPLQIANRALKSNKH
ncbi:MAG: DUF1289 domain-containing protein [Psychrobium sp.]|mgnify:CR=1 FL=1